MKSPLSASALMAACVLAAAPAMHAAIIASDNFSYTAGTNLNGANGGSGWAAGWSASATAAAAATTQTHGSSTVAQFTGTAPNADAFAQRALATAFTGDTLFVSFTLEAGVTPNSDFFALWLEDTTPSTPYSSQTLNTGLGTANDLFARATATTAATVTGPAATANTVYQIVAQYSKSVSGAANAFDTVTFWVNPANSAFATPIGSRTFSGLTSISRVGFRGAGNESGDIYYVDNLTLATTWNEVVPVPEPAPLGLAASAAGLALLLRRRRAS